MDEPRTDWDDFLRDAGAHRQAQGQAGDGPRSVPDLSPLIAIVEALRRAIPHELQEQFNALQRELLLTLRALIDWYLDRLDNPELTPQVEDIPIE
jgi:hypothetical protein